MGVCLLGIIRRYICLFWVSICNFMMDFVEVYMIKNMNFLGMCRINCVFDKIVIFLFVEYGVDVVEVEFVLVVGNNIINILELGVCVMVFDVIGYFVCIYGNYIDVFEVGLLIFVSGFLV